MVVRGAQHCVHKETEAQHLADIALVLFYFEIIAAFLREKKMVGPIVKAIMDANLGFTPINNGENVRINIPPLTEERRKDLCKQARGAGENAKMSIRNARREVVEAHKKFKKDGLEEDICKDAEVEIQKHTDTFTKKVDEIVAAKEKEIMTV